MRDPAPSKSTRITTRRQVSGMMAGFVRMPLKEKVALGAAFLLLGIFSAALRLVPFRRLAPLLGTPVGAIAYVPLVNAGQAERARLVKRAVRRAARIAPFRSDCLPQILAGTVLCRLLAIPATGHLGVRMGTPPRFAAHAWLCAGPVAVTGGPSFGEFAVVLCFAIPKPAAAERIPLSDQIDLQGLERV